MASCTAICLACSRPTASAGPPPWSTALTKGPSAKSSPAPRGFDPAVSSRLAGFSNQFKGSLDYLVPLFSVDRAILGPVAYLRNFELTLHGDWAAFRSPSRHGSLYSVGADLTAVLGNFFWIPYPTRIGVSYNGGSSYAAFAEQELPMERFKLSMIFSVELQ